MFELYHEEITLVEFGFGLLCFMGCIATYVISVYNYQRCEFESSSGAVYSIQHHVIKFVSHLRQVGGLLLVLRFPPLIKLTAAI
jgi:hypothetical protein